MRLRGSLTLAAQAFVRIFARRSMPTTPKESPAPEATTEAPNGAVPPEVPGQPTFVRVNLVPISSTPENGFCLIATSSPASAAEAEPTPPQEAPVMSLKTDLVKVETFFIKVKDKAEILFTHAPSWASAADADITYMAPIVEGVLDLVDPAAEPVVAIIITRVEASLSAASVVITDIIKGAGSAPTLLTYLQSINTNMGSILSSLQITDAELVKKIEAVVSIVTGEVTAIISEVEAFISAQNAAAAAAASAQAAAKAAAAPAAEETPAAVSGQAGTVGAEGVVGVQAPLASAAA